MMGKMTLGIVMKWNPHLQAEAVQYAVMKSLYELKH